MGSTEINPIWKILWRLKIPKKYYFLKLEGAAWKSPL
jgi:hypothetical protein